MVSSREFKVSYGTLRGLEFGAGGSRKILAVHGWLDNAASFTPIAPLLDDAHVVAVDLAGHGLSDHRPAGVSYHLVDYVPDVVEVADRLDWKQFTLLGHSLGAGISSLIAAALPERIERLCLIDGVGPVSGLESDCPARLKRAIHMHAVVSHKLPGIHSSVDSAVSARLRATDMEPGCARLIVERNLSAAEGGYAWRTDRRVTAASPVYLTEPQVRAFLSAIDAPVLLVVASNGVIVERATTAARIDCLKDVEVVELPGNHHLHMDEPDPVARAINEFLGEGS